MTMDSRTPTAGTATLGVPGQADAFALAPPEQSGRRSASRWGEFRLTSRIGLVVMLGLLISGLLAPLLPLDNPLTQTLTLRNAAPSAQHLLGTDLVGRDVLSRIIFGSGSAFEGIGIGLLVMVVIGVPWGLAAGFGGTAVDEALMRIADAFLSFPALILSIGIIAVLGPSMLHSMASVGLISSPAIARLLRSAVLPLKNAEFVLVSGSLGAGRLRIALRHVLPNAMAPVLVQGFALASYFLIIEAALGFLGLGVPPPAPSWGQDLANAYLYFTSNPFATVVPGVAIAIGAWSISAVGDGLREVLVLG
jgi:ABC-type dipeptide/oligopeptide/nickel transport system permease subunit